MNEARKLPLKKNARLFVRLPDAMLIEAEVRAAAQCRTLSEYIRELIRQDIFGAKR